MPDTSTQLLVTWELGNREVGSSVTLFRYS